MASSCNIEIYNLPLIPDCPQDEAWLFGGNMIGGSGTGLYGRVTIADLKTCFEDCFCGLQDVITNDPILTTDNTITGGGFDLIFDNTAFRINGTFQYVDGNETADYVLTSDASGNGTWQPAQVTNETWQETLDNGSVLNKNNTVDAAGFDLIFDNVAFAINGTLQYVDGNESAGYVLTSDASGNATWQAAQETTETWQETLINGSTLTQNNTVSGGSFILQFNSTDLRIQGALRYVDGNQGAAKVLTSDADGDATWQPAPGATTYTVDNGLTASTATNFQLGGTLLGTTDIELDGNTFSILNSGSVMIQAQPFPGLGQVISIVATDDTPGGAANIGIIATSGADYIALSANNTDGSAQIDINSTPGLIQFTGINLFSNLARFTEGLVLSNYTVATLPTVEIGRIALVTDATAPTFLAIVVGGGAIFTPVVYNGTNWVCF